MGSSSKTERLKLNQWTGADIPKRIDFNNDNILLDRFAGGHIQDADIHVTASDKVLWNTSCTAGSYFGTNAPTRKVELGFTPRCVMVYAAGIPPVTVEGDNKLYVYSGAINATTGSMGLSPATGGFSVTQSTTPITGSQYAALNKAGVTYLYLAWK